MRLLKRRRRRPAAAAAAAAVRDGRGETSPSAARVCDELRPGHTLPFEKCALQLSPALTLKLLTRQLKRIPAQYRLAGGALNFGFVLLLAFQRGTLTTMVQVYRTGTVRTYYQWYHMVPIWYHGTRTTWYGIVVSTP